VLVVAILTLLLASGIHSKMALTSKRGASASNFYFELAKGNIPGDSIGNIFGHIPDLDVADGLIAFWDEKQMITFPAAAGSVYVSSENASDTATYIGTALDSDYIEHPVVVTLNGQVAAQVLNAAGGTNNFIWVNSLFNFSTVPTLGKVYLSSTNTLTAGKPTDTTKIMGISYFDTESIPTISHEYMS